MLDYEVETILSKRIKAGKVKNIIIVKYFKFNFHFFQLGGIFVEMGRF